MATKNTQICWIQQTKQIPTNVGGGVIAIASNSSMLFVNIDDSQEDYLRIAAEYGNGVGCFTGHSIYKIFAYSENTLMPRIFVVNYSGLGVIKILQRNEAYRYNALQFSENDYLIALVGMPRYELQVWNWRNGELLGTHTTTIISDQQILRCCISSSLTCLNMGKNGKRIDFWDIHFCRQKAHIVRKNIKVPCDASMIPFDINYANDGSILFINKFSTVWQISHQTKKSVKIITWEEELENETPFVVPYKSGILIWGPLNTLMFYTKNPTKWEPLWSLKSKESIEFAICTQDQFIGVTKFNGILKLKDEEETQEILMIKPNRRPFVLMCIVNPAGDYLVTVDKLSFLNVIEFSTGKQVFELDIDPVDMVASHPTIPMVVFGDNKGYVWFYSILNPKNVKLMYLHHLSHNSIVHLAFEENGILLVAMDSVGDFYIIDDPRSNFQIIKYIQNTQFYISLIVYCTKNTFLMTGLVKTDKIYRGDEIVQYSINIQKRSEMEDVPVEMQSLKLKDQYTTIIQYSKDDKTKFACIPYMSTKIVIAQITSDSDENLEFQVIATHDTCHKQRYYLLSIYSDFLVSYGLDHVCVWNKETMDLITSYRASNPFTGGVDLLIADPHRRYIVTKETSYNFSCTRMREHNYDKQKHTLLIQSFMVPDIKLLFQKRYMSRSNVGLLGLDKTYFEQKAAEVLAKEIEMCKSQREEINEKLKSLQNKMNTLIDKNESLPEEEQLAISVFNLDKEGIELKTKNARIDRENYVKSTKQWCDEKNSVIDWIIANTWNKMEVKGTTLRGIFTKIKTENYALLQLTKANIREFTKVILWRTMEQHLSTNDVFHPWKAQTSAELIDHLAHQPDYVQTDDVKQQDLSSQSSVSNDSIAVDSLMYSLSGTTSHMYITPQPFRYHQFEVVTFYQMMAEMILGQYDILQLRKYYNEVFEKMMKSKKHEMGVVLTRNDRLRTIQSELNILESLKSSDIVHDDDIWNPEYHNDELPETAVVVQDHEVPVRPYISPSQQKILDEIAAEKERRRLALLADDFRERALVKMMNGVLEVRWEDEIKKTPPPPPVMLSDKDPKDYVDEDLLAIQGYELALKQLYLERDKYRNMLFDERTKIQNGLNEQIQKFNTKVAEVSWEKMRVEFAIGTEDLKLLRNSLFHFQRIQYSKKEENLRQGIIDLQIEIEKLTELHSGIEEEYQLLKTKYEDIQTKDRSLDKQFKTTFAEFTTPSMIDQSYRIFRRRPKWQMRANHTEAMFLDMAKRVTSQSSVQTGPPLPEECFAYLQAIEQSDKFSNAPNGMDQSTWKILCKMRRVKIEVEFRVRASGAQLADADATSHAFVKDINNKKFQLASKEQELQNNTLEKQTHIINRTIQICFKVGHVEIPRSGHMSDFTASTILHHEDIKNLNNIINKVGQKKIKAMETAAIFRRKIIFKEWVHKVLRMKISEKKEFIKMIEKCKITKEVQMWLGQRNRGWSVDIDEAMADRRANASIKILDNSIKDLEIKIDSVNEQIEARQAENNILDRQIQSLNLIVSHLSLTRNIELELKAESHRKRRIGLIAERSRLIRKVQQQHAKILELTTMLELLKLRTYPTLNVIPEQRLVKH